MLGDEPPHLSDEQVLQIIRRVVCKPDFYAHSRCQGHLRALGYDLQTVAELIAECSADELDKHALDDQYPSRKCYIVVLDIHVTGESRPFYVKVALLLPELESGYLLSFHLRT